MYIHLESITVSQAPNTDFPLKIFLPIKWQLQKFCEPEFLVAACISDLSHPATKYLTGSLRKAGFTLAPVKSTMAGKTGA